MKRLCVVLFFTVAGFKINAQPVEEVKTSSTISNVAGLIVYNNKLLFGGNGVLCSTDGTDVGTGPLTNSTIGFMFGKDADGYAKVFNGKLFFEATNGADGKQLWTSDGTSSGSQLFKKFTSSNYIGATIRYFIEFNAKLYFLLDDKVTGLELWSSDGTSSGTNLVKDINPTGNGFDALTSGAPVDPSFTIMNNKLYFKANDGVHGLELWVTDGSVNGTQMVKDIYVSPSSSGFLGSGNARVCNFCVYNNKLYFAALEGGSGYYVWVSDGTEAGTKEFLSKDNVNFNLANNFTVFNNKLYFYGSSNVQITPNVWETQAGLWSTDGTAAGTTFIKGFNVIDGDNGLSDETRPGALRVFNNKLYFAAAEPRDSQLHFYVSDGTSSGTTLIKKINTSGSSFNTPIVNSQTFVSNVFDNKLYFVADDGKGFDLYSSDGTGTGTVKVNSPTHTFTQQLINTQELKLYNGSLYFSANYSGKSDLWRIHGSSTDVKQSNQLPLTIKLDQNFPNPFNPITIIKFTVPQRGLVTLKIFDVLGREVANLVNTEYEAGNYSVEFNASNLPSGIYFDTLSENTFSQTKKMVLLK